MNFCRRMIVFISSVSQRKRSGFTLVELLMVIAIIGILASLTLVSLRGAGAKARDAKVKTNVSSIDKAISQYELDNQKFFVDPVSATINISPTSSIATALSSYINSSNLNPTKVAKYTTNAAGSSFAMAWELENTSETAVVTGSGVYNTNIDNVPGSVGVLSAKSSALRLDRGDSNRVIVSDLSGNYQGM